MGYHFLGVIFKTLRGPHTSIRELPKDWGRHPGRPRHTWLWTLEADLQPAQPQTELSMATCPGQRTLEAACGNGHAPVRVARSEFEFRDDDDDDEDVGQYLSDNRINFMLLCLE